MDFYCNALCEYIQAGEHPSLQLSLTWLLLTPPELEQLGVYTELESSHTMEFDDILGYLRESLRHRDRRLRLWSRTGNLERLRLLLPQVTNGINMAFVEAARGGQLRVLAALWPLRSPSRVNTYRQALWTAADAGQLETVKFFESKYPELLTQALRLALARRCCASGQFSMALLEYLFPCQNYDGQLLQAALNAGCESLCLYLLGRIELSPLLLNRCFVLSAETGYLTVMENLQARGADNFSGALAAATKAGQVLASQALLALPAFTPTRSLLTECFYDSIRKCGSMEMVRLLIEAGASDFNLGLEAAAESGNLGAAALMLELGATELDDPFYWAARHGHFELVMLLREAGASNLQQALEGAAHGGYLRVVKYLLRLEPELPCEGALQEALVGSSARQNPKLVRCLLKRRPSNVRQIALSSAWRSLTPAVREVLDEYIKNEPGQAASSV